MTTTAAKKMTVVAAAAAAVAVIVARKEDYVSVHLTLIRRFFVHELQAQEADPLPAWRRIKRVRELLFLLSIERHRLLEVAKAKKLYPDDPSAVYRMNPLRHVKTQAQLANTAEDMMDLREKAKRVPIATELVLIGGGHAHVHVIRMFGMAPVEGVRITVVAKDVETPYSGMLPGHVAGLYSRRECHIDLQQLARFAGVRLIHAEATSIDTATRTIRLGDDRPPVPYDVLSLDVGITPDYPSSGVTPVKPIAAFSKTWDDLLSKLEGWSDEDERRRVVVVGGGAGGVELALAMRARIRASLVSLGKSPDIAHFSLLTRGPRILKSHSDGVKACLERALRERDIEVVANCEAIGVEESGFIECNIDDEKKKVPFDECVWCTQARAPKLLECLERDEAGFALVDEYQRCATVDGEDREHARIFAVGDCSSVAGHPRPKAGVFAVMAGMSLYANILSEVSGTDKLAHIPQSSFLGLIGTGDKSCVASRGELSFQADWLWDLKDWIDRKWMWQYTRGLPSLLDDDDNNKSAPAAFRRAGEAGLKLLRESAMRCGGCGAKVGANPLSQALKSLPPAPPSPHAVVLAGVDSADDAGVVKYSSESVLAHTIDFFRALVDDPYLFGQIAANHALSDCDAMNSQPASACALVVVPYAAERSVQSDLLQVMRGVRKTLDAAGCALVGGHTCEGAELSVGLAVNGVVGGGTAPSSSSSSASGSPTAATMTKGGLQTGDVLILTKPIGTGCIFAADMRARASYRTVKAATDSMLVSNRPASKILASFDCVACTDVTGFGLVGHLAEMCRASEGASISLDLEQVPFLPGAVELASQGLFSSLQPENIRAKRAVSNHSQFADDPAYALLFDPQTAGGLLASVSESRVDEILSQLREAGYVAAAAIGVVESANDVLAFPASLTIV